jgi:RNA methyltransferase, TrmH family
MLSKSQIKYIHSLQTKKYRQKYNQFIAEGDKIVRELLVQQYPEITHLYALPEWIIQHEPSLKCPAFPVNATELHQISALSTPNQVLAILNIPSTKTTFSLKGTITLALQTIQDPGNMGTLIRIADWFGISQLCCSPDCADPFQPKTVQSSMGSIARVKILETSLTDLLEKNPTIDAYAAVLTGKSINEFQHINEGILFIGNESNGLSKEIIEKCKYHIAIPRLGKAESLNAAVAAGIICAKLCL